MKKVIFIQHDPHDGPGGLLGLFVARRVGVEIVRPYAGEVVPTNLDRASGLVVLGGPMSVNEQYEYPYLTDEIELIQSAVATGKPVLGVCLGSQLLAAALGASIRPNPVKEVGWHPVELTDEANGDPLFGGVRASFPAFHWHGDTFDLPTGSVHLAASPLCRHQAFRYGANAYGVQFHLEVDMAKVDEMVTVFAAPLRAVGLAGWQVRREADELLPEMQAVAGIVFGRWADLLV